MEYVIDMQGFKQPVNDYILKELAIVPLTQDVEPHVFTFKPPFPWRRLTDKYKKENMWLQCNYHGIPRDAGQVPYDLVGKVIKECLDDVKKVYVAGSVQKKWLERFELNVYDIMEFGYPPIDKIKIATVCSNHNGFYKTNCVLHNVKLFITFLKKS